MMVSVDKILLLALVVALGAGGSAQARQLAVLDSLMEAALANGLFPGAVLHVQRGDDVLHHRAYGFAEQFRYGGEPIGRPVPMTVDHVFDLASLTKVFATTFGVMVLMDGDEIDLDAPVVRYLPALTGTDKAQITVRQLLMHTSGLPPWEPVYYHAEDPEGALLHIRNLPLAYTPGSARHYSDLSFMLLGYLIEHVSGQRLDAFLAGALYDSLGLTHTAFVPRQQGLTTIAATSHGNPFERRMVYDDAFGYLCDEEPASWNGWRTYVLRGEVNDGNAFYAHQGIAGHAGLFSTAADLQRLATLLLGGGVFEGKRLISAETIAAFTRLHAFGNGLGWAMDPESIQARGAPVGTFGHTGFTGTSVVLVPRLDLTILLLTNRQHGGVDEDGHYPNLNPLRQQIVSTVLAELGAVERAVSPR